MNSSLQSVPASPTAAPPAATIALTAIVAALFFASGGMALIYELCWIRLIGLHLGSTALALTIVLMVFMGGLAIGAAAAGHVADRWTNPLTRYGYLEVIVALYSGLSPLLFEWAMPRYLQTLLGTNTTASFATLTTLRFIIVTLLLLPPTVLMGATLPLLSRFWANRHANARRGAGLLYGLNTLGAFVGVITAGFILMPRFGLEKTVFVTAMANGALGLAAIGMGRMTETRSAIAPAVAPQSDAPPGPGPGAAIHIAVLLTGFGFMVAEIAWTRVLMLVLGASVYAVSIVLATALAGLGLGAAGAAALMRAAPDKSRIIFYSLAIASAIGVCVSAVSFRYLPGWFMELYFQWDFRSAYANVVFVQCLFSAMVIFVPALLMGGLFPAAIRVALDAAPRTAQRVGRLYASNTVGDIVGAFAGGIILIPVLGVRGSLLAAAGAQCLAAAAVALKLHADQPARAMRLAGAALAVIIAAVYLTPAWHRDLMSIGMYQYAHSYKELVGEGTRGLEQKILPQQQTLFYRDGLTATVSITQTQESGVAVKSLRINGKVDGSNYLDMPTQRLSAHIPLLLHDDPQQVCVIGMGTGCTGGSASLHPVQHVDVVEIEQAVVDAARLFSNDNYNLHENPKVTIHVTDGRFFLRQRPQRYDVIVSEPSNPWQIGNSDLFTLEYFQLGAAALKDDGIFCQWVQTYTVAPSTIQTVARTFGAVFPSIHLVTTASGDTVMIGGKQRLKVDFLRMMERIGRNPKVMADMQDPRIGIRNMYDVAARFRIGPDRIAAFAGEGPLHTDDLPVIAYEAPRSVYQNTQPENERLIGRYADGCANYLVGIEDAEPTAQQGFLTRLAGAYREYYGADSLAAQITLQVAQRLAAKAKDDPQTPPQDSTQQPAPAP